MEPKELLPIMFERSNAAIALWNIEIVVVLGLIAFLASAGAIPWLAAKASPREAPGV